jgi:hypothetical protein
MTPTVSGKPQIVQGRYARNVSPQTGHPTRERRVLRYVNDATAD